VRHELRGATVVIVGASSGIGRAAARRFAEAGARLVLASRSLATLDEVVGECRRAGAEAIPVEADVTSTADLDAVVAAALARFGRIDVWVAAASVYGFGAFDEMPAAEARTIIDTNLHGTIDGIRAALPALRDSRGSIVVIGSVFSQLASPIVWAYVTSKHAVAGFAASIRQELRVGPRPVDVSMVWPATIDTPIHQHAANRTGQAVRPIPPVVDPDRVARAIVRVARRPRRRVVVGAIQGSGLLVHSLFPALADRLMASAMRRIGLRPGPVPESDGTVHEPDPDTERERGGWR
jgi:short-subunit dehydrogenase